MTKTQTQKEKQVVHKVSENVANTPEHKQTCAAIQRNWNDVRRHVQRKYKADSPPIFVDKG